ncbi:hypothetical protein [Dyadobacter sp. BHUBP1]|uniref:hypothetical protein n=1 Tax=Dyadobacter sp. BHUBP1 TaxID=3424178 RepID=UPI003D32B3BD
MNQKNLDYLQAQVKYTGFGEGLESQLAEQIKSGAMTFSLTHQAFYGKDEAVATLHFKKSSQDNYFFNSYDLAVKQEGMQVPLKQSFFLGYDNNFTLKEAYNLLSGRSVYKELAKLIDDGNGRLEAKGEKYHAWVKLDFGDKDKNDNYKEKRYHQNWGFDLDAVLSKLPIKELADPKEKERLIASLQKGNVHAVTFAIAGNEVRRYIEAVPQFRSINQYNADMERVGFRRSAKEATAQSESQQVVQKADDPGPPKVTAAKQDPQQKSPPRQKVAKARKKGLSPG